MSDLLLTEPLRRLERAALAALPPGTLMARAAAAVADATTRLARTLEPGRPVLALVGPGNNGADALLAALLLRQRGYACGALALRPDGPSGGDAAGVWRRARAAGLRIDGPSALPELLAAAPIVIDGLFGIGLDRPLDADAQQLCEATAQAGLPVVSVDVPSGIDADTGAIVGAAAGAGDARAAHGDDDCRQAGPAHRCRARPRRRAERGGARPGRRKGAFARSAGNEIGTLFDAACAAAAWRPRARDSNKGSHGSVLAYGGAAGMRGAALLAARGAQALGAGKVLVGTPDGELFDPGQPQLMTGAANPDFASFDAVVIGCGLGRCAPARERVAAALAGAPALVLDADALNLLAADPTLADARFTGAPAPQRRVMTPHPLEAARLLGCDAAQVQADRRGAALALARRYRMVALLKGAGSVVATPEGNWSIVDAGGPALASAGTGDVLAGMIGALLARGQSPEQAVCAAAWLHGRAGSRFEIAHGHAEGLSAAELPQLVRDALHELIESSRTPE